MSAFPARYFDGRGSVARAVRVEVDADALRVIEAADVTRVPLRHVRVGDRLGAAPRVIYLADAGELHGDDQAAIERLARRLGQGRLGAGVFALESRLWVALLALSLGVAAIWLGARHGLPWLAAAAVERVPAGVESGMGAQTLSALDRWALRPSGLAESRQDALRQRLEAVCAAAGDCPSWRMVFRGGGAIGANAMALPGGTLVFTDEIVNLARHDDELIAVAAHELAHVRHRHGLRQVLAGAGVVLLSQLFVGDLPGIGDLASGVPALLLQSGYSRSMESEADAYAMDLMQRACLPPHRFADLLLRLEGGHAAAAATLISTHPDLRQRIKVFQSRELDTRGC